MIAILSLLLIAGLSILITRVASIALVHTGLSRESARFQARSAFSGVGFTTSEAESVVTHPVRRRIVMTLMLIGNIGIVTAASSLMLSFLDMGASESMRRDLAFLSVGMLALLVLSSSAWVDSRVSRWISAALNRFTDLQSLDFAELLHLRGEYGVSELRLDEDDWLVGKTVAKAGIGNEGLLLLGLQCPGNNFIGAPGPDIQIHSGDTLILYGRVSRIRELDDRRSGGAGDASHAAARQDFAKTHEQERARAKR